MIFAPDEGNREGVQSAKFKVGKTNYFELCTLFIPHFSKKATTGRFSPVLRADNAARRDANQSRNGCGAVESEPQS